MTTARDRRRQCQDARRRAAESVNLWKLSCLLASLALFSSGLISHFGLESKAFLYLAALTVAGFAVHYFLPLPYRLPFFLALSLGAIAFLLGPVPAAWLIGLGLVAHRHLPLARAVRAARGDAGRGWRCPARCGAAAG